MVTRFYYDTGMVVVFDKGEKYHIGKAVRAAVPMYVSAPDGG